MSRSSAMLAGSTWVLSLAVSVLEVFADRLRDEGDLAALRSDLLSAVTRTMAPAYSSLWLKGARE